MLDGRVFIRERDLLYSDEVGRDACGIGGGRTRAGKPSHEVVQKALLALKNMEHRGGICGQSGDGAGVTCQLPHAFFKEEARRLHLDQARALKPEHRLAVGVFFFQPNDPQGRDQAKALIREVLAGGPVHLMGWRSVPTRGDMLPPEALASRPSIEQLILRIDASEGGTIDVERWLYRKRLELRQRFHQAPLSVFVSSLSTTLVNYRGLLPSFPLADFFPALLTPAFETGLAIFHRRYSTNTYPNWTLAQPFRFSCHNGEINTL